MRWLERLASRPEPDIAAQMSAAYDATAGGDHAAALAIWGPLAQAGVARAQNNVGACFAEGLGVARDAALAERWLTLSANRSPLRRDMRDALKPAHRPPPRVRRDWR